MKIAKLVLFFVVLSLYGVSFFSLIELFTIGYYKINLQNFSKVHIAVLSAEYKVEAGGRNSKSSIFEISGTDINGNQYTLRSKFFKKLYNVRSSLDTHIFLKEVDSIWIYVNKSSYKKINFYINGCDIAIAECNYVDQNLLPEIITFFLCSVTATVLFKKIFSQTACNSSHKCRRC